MTHMDRMAGEDYAKAVSGERGRCFRYVYDDNGKPGHCWRPITTTGWLYAAYERTWTYVDSCERHAPPAPQASEPLLSWPHGRRESCRHGARTLLPIG